MIRFVLTFVFIAWFATSDVFAQRRQQAPPPAEEVILVETVDTEAVPVQGPTVLTEESFIRLPVQDDEIGRIATWAFERVQTILATSTPEPVEPDWELLAEDYESLNPDEVRHQALVNAHQVIWQRAFNAIGALAEFVSPKDEDGQPDIPQDFVPNPYAAAHYFYGKGMIYMNMVNSGIFVDSIRLELARNAAENFEAFVQNGIAPVMGYMDLVTIYTDILDNPRRALMFANRAIAEEPNNSNSHFMRAVALRGLGRGGEACAALIRALDLDEMTTEDSRNSIIEIFGC